MSIRRAAFILAWCLLVLAAGSIAAQTTAPSVTLRSVRDLEKTAVDQNGRQFAIGGLSGITYLGEDQFIAAEDNSDKLVRLRIAFTPDGSIDTASVSGGVTLADSADFEGIAFTGPARGTVLLSEEAGDTIREYRLADGARVAVTDPPMLFRPPNRRANFGFESLSLRGPDELWTGNEEALSSDGDRSDASFGSAVRLLRFTRGPDGRFAPAQQYVYLTDPIHKRYSDANRATSRSGLSDLVALPDGRLLALERSFALMGPKHLFSDFENRVYEVRTDRGATDVSTDPYSRGLKGKPFVPVTKRLLWKHRGNDIANLEGLALGPKLGPERWALVGVVDNNREPLFANRLVTFELNLSSGSAK